MHDPRFNYDLIQLEACDSCGESLPTWDYNEPDQPYKMHWVHREEMQVDEEGMMVSGGDLRPATPQEIAEGDFEEYHVGPYWICPRCGHLHDVNEAWEVRVY